MKKEKCDTIWGKAKDAIGREASKIQDEFKAASILKITEGTRKYFCYKKSNWKTKGWCYTDGDMGSENWGICSPSCAFYNQIMPEVELNH